jgi:hypothetical protein
VPPQAAEVQQLSKTDMTEHGRSKISFCDFRGTVQAAISEGHQHPYTDPACVGAVTKAGRAMAVKRFVRPFERFRWSLPTDWDVPFHVNAALAVLLQSGLNFFPMDPS